MQQPLQFITSKFSNLVYKLKKSLYELEHAPMAQYENIVIVFLNSGFKRSRFDPNLNV
jgi:hypothetical protein